jgi:hypothetical protein
VRQRLDVDAAGGDVGRHQHLQGAVLEARQRVRALRLATVAVDAVAGDPLLVEELGEAVRPVLGAGEDEDVLDVPPPQQLHQQVGLQVLRDRIDRLRDAGRRRRLALDVQPRRLAQHLAGQLDDRLRQGRREEQRLLRPRQVLEHPPDVRKEAHVQHPVRLVEDEDLEAVELRVVVLEVVEEPPRRRHQDVDPLAEVLLLRPHGDAAEDGRSLDGRELGEPLHVLDDLRRQLPRGGEHQYPGRAAGLVVQPVQDRQQEGRGLAAARHRAGEHVLAGEGGGDGVLLNGSGLLEAQALDAAEKVGVKAEIREIAQASCSFRAHAIA